jgi:D-3-phosphoglycerate dehydrogenase
MLRKREGRSVEKVTILVTGMLDESCIELLRNPPVDLRLPYPIELVIRPDCSRKDLLSLVPDADVLLTRSETTVDKEVIDAAPYLSVIARAAVGYGNIDLDYATLHGALVVNTPGKNTNSAAELTLGLMLNMARHIPAADETMKHGGWDRHRFTGTELMGKKIGIIGLGNVGHRVAKFCNGFDMDVYAYDPYISADVFRRHRTTQCSSVDEILEIVDILTVHVPLNKETKNMFRADNLSRMRKGSWVVNAARGGVVVEEDLFQLLESGHLDRAGIDTWEDEPQPIAKLVKHPKVVATPHIGASTVEAQQRIGETIAVQILKALRGEIVDYPVNLPNLSVLPGQSERNASVLLEKMGRMLAQLHEFRPQNLILRIPAEFDQKIHELLCISAIKGYLSHTSDDFVSYVNARLLFENRGLSLRVESAVGSGSPRSMRDLQLEVAGSAAKDRVLLGAALYDGRVPRITLINEFEFESEPTGELLVVTNFDRPGVVGAIGGFLAKLNVNIAQFDLSRNQTGGEAMSIIRVDSVVDSSELLTMEKIPNIIRVKKISGL